MDKSPVGEVRTFLIADVRGYTRFCQERGDEMGARLAARFATLSRDTVAERGGEVIELRGDEALAVFSSARQALRAAVDLQDAYAREMAADSSLPLNVGIGVDSGEAVALDGGYRGGALNLAARLCALAGPGEVLASEGVIHLARKVDDLDYVERGVASLKGFAAPVRIISVVPQAATSTDSSVQIPAPTAQSSSESRLPIGGFLGALPAAPLVAREAELQSILATVDAVAGGIGRLVMLAGEPGVGKTRLAQEVTLNLRNRQFLLAAGRCYEAHRTVPFYPFLDALAALYAVCPATVRAEVPRRWPYLRHLLPDADIRAPHEGHGDNGQEEQQRLFRTVTGFIQAITETVPVAILLDDLHWADQASLELLQHLTRHTRAERVFMLGTYRDVEVGRQHPLEAALRDLMREDLVDRIAVHRLAPDGTAALMAASFGEEEISDEFAGLVHRRTEGNPFFVQHVLRVLVERGDVFNKDGKWDRRAIDEIEVPESVRSVIGQRLSQLSEETQEILREASILGQTFEFDLLQQMAGRSEAEIERALEEVETRGLVREADRDSYAFDHALTQQALYAELPGRRRRRLHLAAAEALGRLPQRQREARAGELGWHFLEGDEVERALPYVLLAARQAEAVFAQDDAEHQYDTALDLADQLDDQEHIAQILEYRGALRLVGFKGKGAAADFERLLAMARRSGNRELEVQALLGLARARYVLALDETDIAYATACRELYEAAYDLAQKLDDKRAMVRALLGTRWLADFWPDYRETSMANRRKALAISEELGDEDLIIECRLTLWRTLGGLQGAALGDELERQLRERNELHKLNEHYFALMWAHLGWGSFERAVECCDAGVQIAGELGIPPVQYPTLKGLSLIELGRFGEAWAALQQEVAGEGHPFGRAMQSLGKTVYLLELMAYDRVIETARDFIKQARAVQRTWMRRWGNELLVLALLHSGRLDDAGLAEATKDLASMGEELQPLAQAEVALYQGRLEDGLALAAEAAAEATEQGQEPDRTTALSLQAHALLRQDNPAEAIVAADEALALARRIKSPVRIWQIQTGRGEILTALGRSDEAAEAGRSAEETIRQLASTVPQSDLRQQFLTRAMAMLRVES